MHVWDKTAFLRDYWQKEFLVIRQAIPHFTHRISPDELAGLAMESEIESRMVFEIPHSLTGIGIHPSSSQIPSQRILSDWKLKRGPFHEADFQNLPKTHWTLLVQGVDRFVPEVEALLVYFDFIPQWRLDDVMISFAPEQGSVGPHYDNYDVFLYQAKGRRKWLLTTQGCDEKNYIDGLPLRIMKEFSIEHEIILEEGDMLYLPPHVGHHGISMSKDCMTYSFGYRSYNDQEMWDSFADALSESSRDKQYYRDPDYSTLKHSGEIPREAWLNAKALLQSLLNDEVELQKWFGRFATTLDQQAEQLLPLPLEEDELLTESEFLIALGEAGALVRNSFCRFAFIAEKPAGLEVGSKVQPAQFFANSCLVETCDVSVDLIQLVCQERKLVIFDLLPFLDFEPNIAFLYSLWTLQWLEFEEMETAL